MPFTRNQSDLVSTREVRLTSHRSRSVAKTASRERREVRSGSASHARASDRGERGQALVPRNADLTRNTARQSIAGRRLLVTFELGMFVRIREPAVVVVGCERTVQ
jgi:hypothetical protein